MVRRGDANPVADLERRNAELEILYDSLHDLTSTLSVQQVLRRLLDRTLSHLGAEIGSILLLGDDGRLRIIAAQGLPEDIVANTVMKLGEGISGHVAASRQALLVQDVEADPQFRRRNNERYYTRSLLCCPLLRGDGVLGVVNVNNKRSHEPFQPDDSRLLEGIAASAAVALGNARRYEETLRRAQRDALTGLANHGHLYATLEVEISRARRHGRELALAMIDVDHFKAYNDRFGHRAGDEGLVQIGAAIERASRAADLVARYGGEEFAVILPETDLEGAVAFGEKIRQSVEAEGFGSHDAVSLTVSVGVAVYGGDGDRAAPLVEAADSQLYRAKSEGRNRVCAETPEKP